MNKQPTTLNKHTHTHKIFAFKPPSNPKNDDKETKKTTRKKVTMQKQQNQPTKPL